VKVLFWGTPHFAVPTLRALVGEGHDVVGVVTQPDRPRGRGRTPSPTPVRQVAETEGLPVLTPEKPRGEDFMARIRALDPEVSVVVAYGHILLPEVLELPPRGSWNVHASLLPKLRGAAPVHWAIARGFTETGVTVMQMEAGLDSGPMLVREPEPIAPTDTSSGLALRLSELGASAMIQGLSLLEFGEPELEEQNHGEATYAPKVSRDVARIDWSRPGSAIIDHVRAMDEVPGAWTTRAGQPLKLFSPTPGVEDPPAESGAIGEVVDVDADRVDGLAVRTGEGVVRFAEIQPPGKRRMDVSAWIRGRSLEAGERFGD
jgi:methionyl-tRNA formyltransferase